MRCALIAFLLAMPAAAWAQAGPSTPLPVGFNSPGATDMRPPPTAEARFEAANTTHDGKLTLAQAQAAGLARLASLFPDIDTAHQGYVTWDELQAYRRAHQARRP